MVAVKSRKALDHNRFQTIARLQVEWYPIGPVGDEFSRFPPLISRLWWFYEAPERTALPVPFFPFLSALTQRANGQEVAIIRSYPLIARFVMILDHQTSVTPRNLRASFFVPFYILIAVFRFSLASPGDQLAGPEVNSQAVGS